MTNRFKLFILLFFIRIISVGQTYNHTTLWSRLAFQKSINKWDFKSEIDFRQQNDFQKSMINPFPKPFLRWVRLNTTYTTGKFSHSIILPNIIKSYPIIGKNSDLSKSPTIEWRYTFNEEFAQPYKNWTSALRLGYEFRNLKTDNIIRNTARIRFRFSETLSVSKKAKVNLSYEPLYNLPPNKAPNTFSQSQMALRYYYKITKNATFTTGINHVYRKRSSLVEYDMENAIICNLGISL